MKLWDLAGKVYHEAIFRGQMLAAGSSVHRLTEKMKTDAGYVSRQGRLVQVLGSFYLLMVAFLSVAAFLELRTANVTPWNYFVTTASISLQLLIQTAYLMMLTLLATAEILAPELYRWLESLPLSRTQLGSLRILALAREFVAPLAVLAFSTPLVAGIAGGSAVVGVVGLLVGLEHAAVTLGLAVLASWRLRRVLRDSHADDRTSRIARVVTTVVYGVGTLLVVFVMQIASTTLTRLYDSPGMTPDSVSSLLLVLAIAPLPTAPATLLTALVPGVTAGIVPLWAPIVGTVLYGVLGALLLRRVRDGVRSMPGGEAGAGRAGGARASGQADADAHAPVRIAVRNPRRAFRRQIGQAMTRDTQAFISIVFPILIPLIAGIGPYLSDGATDVTITMSVVMAGVVSSWMTIHGLTRLHFGSPGLEATLPIRERDRVFPRLAIVGAIPMIGALLPPLILLAPGSPEQIHAFVDAAGVAFVGPAGFLLKLFLFGRVRTGATQLVLDEVNTGARFWKWAAVLALLLTLGVGLVVAHAVLVGALGRLGHLAALGIIAALGLTDWSVARRRFP
jgi:hypothetical protein